MSIQQADSRGHIEHQRTTARDAASCRKYHAVPAARPVAHLGATYSAGRLQRGSSVVGRLILGA